MNNIRKKRKEKGMTITELCMKVGCSWGYAQIIDAGYSKLSSKMKQKFAQALDCSVEELFPQGEEKEEEQ